MREFGAPAANRPEVGTKPAMGITRVLVAEDDRAIRELLVHHLERDGFFAIEAGDGPAALRASREGVDLLLLDIGLPGIDGFEIARTLRREGRTLPILMLTARTEEIDRVVGFELGADDYVVKPFSPREVVARCRAILRRSGIKPEAGPPVHRFGRLEIDEGAREARVDGMPVSLKPREYALLLALASNPGVAISRNTLLERVWGFDFDGDERTVDVHVRRLRLKLEEAHALGSCLRTVHGFGYKFAQA
jgi:two-component system response regulator ResD